MRKTLLIVLMLLFSGTYLKIQSQTKTETNMTNEIKTNKDDINTAEKIFLGHADECLALIAQEAQNISIKGVALVSYIPGDSTITWVSKMKVVGALTNDKVNYLSIASSKAAEMAETHLNSGSGIRGPKMGEFGYKGGLIRKVKSGYILAVFSGGSSEQDVDVATKGLELLFKYY
jgi:hypothetical protein